MSYDQPLRSVIADLSDGTVTTIGIAGMVGVAGIAGMVGIAGIAGMVGVTGIARMVGVAGLRCSNLSSLAKASV